MNLSWLTSSRQPAGSTGSRLMAKQSRRSCQVACHATLRLGVSALLTLGTVIGSRRAAENPPPPADLGGAGNPKMECKIRLSSEGVVLSWFVPEGVPCQLQASTDLDQWNAVGA